MGRTVAELENTLGAGELAEWIAFWNIEPFGPEVENFHAASTMALHVNMNRRKGVPPRDASHFMIGKRSIAERAAGVEAKAIAMAKALGAKFE